MSALKEFFLRYMHGRGRSSSNNNNDNNNGKNGVDDVVGTRKSWSPAALASTPRSPDMTRKGRSRYEQEAIVKTRNSMGIGD